MDSRFELISEECLSFKNKAGSDRFHTLLVFRDKQTGVMYIYRHSGNSGGLSVLVDKDGKPMTTFKVKI